jgi:hypothetical protein
MRKKIVFIIFAIFFTLLAHSQVAHPNNQVYFQLGGNGLLTSINYERKIVKKIPLFSNIGFGIYGSDKYITLPIGIKYLYQTNKKKQGFLSIGLGGTYTKAKVYLYPSIPKYPSGIVHKNNFWNFLPSIGYRSISKKQFVYSFDFLLLYNSYRKSLPYIGFSIGKAF